jgi:hypothetical protein
LYGSGSRLGVLTRFIIQVTRKLSVSLCVFVRRFLIIIAGLGMIMQVEVNYLNGMLYALVSRYLY